MFVARRFFVVQPVRVDHLMGCHDSPGVARHYGVRTSNAGGSGSWSNEVVLTSDTVNLPGGRDRPKRSGSRSTHGRRVLRASVVPTWPAQVLNQLRGSSG